VSDAASPDGTAPEPTLAPTFFARAGGEPAIRRVVSELYERLFDDPMVGFLFQGHDRQRIIDQQTLFTSRMLGADVVYTGKPLPEAHAASPILPGHFDRRHHLLRQILEASDLDPSAQAAWLRLDAALRPVLLKQGQVRIEELRQLR
jgi:hemoglobin